MKQRKQPRNKFEQSAWDFLKKNKVKFEYEGLTLPYIIEANYYPDYWLPKQGIVIELKGHFRPGVKRKMVAVKKAHPNLDIRLVLYSHNEADERWAKKNGFPVAIKQIPKEWLN